jgi:hypothetical protein
VFLSVALSLSSFAARRFVLGAISREARRAARGASFSLSLFILLCHSHFAQWVGLTFTSAAQYYINTLEGINKKQPELRGNKVE